MNSILEARNVSFAYGPAKWAIRELSFSLATPERVALLGSNGVGKSTLDADAQRHAAPAGGRTVGTGPAD